MVDGDSDQTSTRALQHLEESRAFLLRLIRAASSIEGLKAGIEEMLAQEAVAPDDDPAMARFIEGLGRKVRNMSDADVTLRLEKLDRRLHALFARMLPLIERVSSGETTLEDRTLAEASTDIDALKRLSRTALAIRGMLARRNVAVPDFRLPLDRAQLQKKLFAIAREEQRARREVIQQVRVMGNDIRQLLDQTRLPSAMRHLLEQMQAGLLANLEHLKAGKSVAELPLPIEEASFVTPLPEETAWPDDEASPSAPSSANTSRPAGSAARADVKPVSDRSDGTGPPGVMRALWLWIRSPWEVSWQDIRQGRYRG